MSAGLQRRATICLMVFFALVECTGCSDRRESSSDRLAKSANTSPGAATSSDAGPQLEPLETTPSIEQPPEVLKKTDARRPGATASPIRAPSAGPESHKFRPLALDRTSDSELPPAIRLPAPDPVPRMAPMAGPPTAREELPEASEREPASREPASREPASREPASREARPAAPSGAEVANAPAAGDEPYTMMRVFYATDRAVVDLSSDGHDARLDPLLAALGIGMTLTFLVLGRRRRARRFMWSLALASLLITMTWAGIWAHGQWTHVREIAITGPHYGNERGTLRLGTCVVSIPRTHQVGEVETPSILRLEVREDVRKHVVLQRIESKPEEVFFRALRDRVQSSKHSEVFVFVHGYNVGFEGAARRTAQIAYDVQFHGAPIFFSWPSQDGLLRYTVDETNVTWAVPHLKQFLLDVVHHSGAKSVNLIAHSMGNRALTRALRELQLQLGKESALFNQVILAAPDVDAEVFRRDLAPALVQCAKHVTLYASSNDQALAASKKVHGYARAGDSGEGLVVIPGIDTIDVSTIDTSLIGHSYYGSNNSILKDIYFVIHDALPASNRRWLRPMSYNGLTYWVFESIQETASRRAPGSFGAP